MSSAPGAALWATDSLTHSYFEFAHSSFVLRIFHHTRCRDPGPGRSPLGRRRVSIDLKDPLGLIRLLEAAYLFMVLAAQPSRTVP